MRFKTLEKLKTGGSGDEMRLSVPLPRSANGMVTLNCPSSGCIPARFQLDDAARGQAPSAEANQSVTRSAIRREAGAAGITCPYCGHDAASVQEFISEEDKKHAIDTVKWAAKQDIQDEIGRMFGGLAKRLPPPSAGRSGVGFTFKPGRRDPPPRAWREDLLRDLRCTTCSRRYGVYAIALFCPDCGTPNLRVHFAREVELIGMQVALARKSGEDGNDELGFRLLGNAHEDVVTAYETYLKHVYAFVARRRRPSDAEELCSKKAIGNAFQSVSRGRQRFAEFAIDPYAPLAAADLAWFEENVEKRHVLGHNLGLSDAAYAEAVGSEEPGRTVRLLADEVLRFASLAAVVVGALDALPEFLPRPQPAAPPVATAASTPVAGAGDAPLTGDGP